MPPFVWVLVDRLRRRGLAIGVDDCVALRAALAAGRGLQSDEALRGVCVALWAKTTDEAELISTAFAGLGLAPWTLRPGEEPDDEDEDEEDQAAASDEAEDGAAASAAPEPGPDPVRAEAVDAGISPLPDLGGNDPGLFLEPRFPLPAREIAQIWRRLTRPSRRGVPVEVDAAATLDRLARSGVATPPVVVPARANRSTVLILLDRNGSMTPYHGYADHVVRAIGTLGRMDGVTVRYFHDVPGVSPDRRALADRPDRLTRRLDAILGAIRPLRELRVHHDPRLARPDGVDLGRHTSAVVVSDAGAARGRYDADRLVDTVAFGRALRRLPRCTVAWLNPVEPARWPGSTAEQVARHLPMFPMTRAGMTQAVDVLRGRPVVLERPL